MFALKARREQSLCVCVKWLFFRSSAVENERDREKAAKAIICSICMSVSQHEESSSCCYFCLEESPLLRCLMLYGYIDSSRWHLFFLLSNADDDRFIDSILRTHSTSPFSPTSNESNWSFHRADLRRRVQRSSTNNWLEQTRLGDNDHHHRGSESENNELIDGKTSTSRDQRWTEGSTSKSSDEDEGNQSKSIRAQRRGRKGGNSIVISLCSMRCVSSRDNDILMCVCSPYLLFSLARALVQLLYFSLSLLSYIDLLFVVIQYLILTRERDWMCKSVN